MPSPHIHIPYPKIFEHRELINKHSLDLEIFFSSATLDEVTKDDIRLLMGLFFHDISLSLHGPFMDLSPGAVDSRIAAVTRERFSAMLDIAEILKPKAVVFHSGYEKWKYAFNVDLWLEKSIETWKPINERAVSQGTPIAIENIFEDEPTSLRRLMEAMDSENFGICFDTGHCNLFSKVPLQDWIVHLGNYITELHLHDNDGTFDSHLPVGDGSFDFITLFSLLDRKNRIYTIEAHSSERVLKSIEGLKAYL